MIADLVGGDRSTYDFSLPIDPSAVGGRDPLIFELAGTRAFQRLKSIRFLGGIDYLLVRSPNGNRGNIRYTRYQHSLGVLRLALLYSDMCGLAASERCLVLTAALLHDIGHGPLSHSLEPVFKSEFGLEHHWATEEIVTGRAKIGRGVYDTLRSHCVDIERLVAIINGEEVTYDGFFSGPINFDTIEGILRADSYVKNSSALFRPEAVVKAAFERSNDADRDRVDRFWQKKDHVYRYLINSKAGVLADFACAMFMRRHIGAITSDDYFGTEEQMFHKLPGLRRLLTSPSFNTEVLQQADFPIFYKARHFFVEPTVDFFGRRDKERYRQTSCARVLSPHSAAGPKISTRNSLHDDSDRSSKKIL